MTYPNLKQRRAFKEVLDGKSIGEASRIAGIRSGALKSQKGWQYLVEKHLPDNLLTKKHREGLNANFTDKYNTEAPDYEVRRGYLDLAYKLKGVYAPEKTQSVNLNIEAKITDNPEFDKLRDRYEEELRAKLTKNDATQAN